MKPSVRTAIAAIAAAHTKQSSVSSAYSYAEGEHTSINVTANGSSISAYDYKNGCHISGTLPSLYHYGVGAHVTLTSNGNGAYSGYDYDTGSHFTVNVSGSSVNMYVNGQGHFAYTA